MDERLVAAWAGLREPAFALQAEALIREFNPTGEALTRVEHVRSAHYAALSVWGVASRWLVRVGVYVPDAPVDNAGFLGTSRVQPAGQARELAVAAGFQAAGAIVSVPSYHVRAGVHDMLWVPFLEADTALIGAAMWGRALSDLRRFVPTSEYPVFTNYAKSMARVAGWADTDAAAAARQRYEAQLAHLFAVASAWSVVHGDAHGENAFNVAGRAVLFDFDTACWAPSVWDLTHLLTRAGTGTNRAFTAAQLVAQFPAFTGEEVEAAVALRQTARMIARHQG